MIAAGQDGTAIYHGLFTNAFGDRGAGFRSLFLAPPELDTHPVDRWLRSLRPARTAEGPGPGTAAACFRLASRDPGMGDGLLVAAVATVDGDFARDEHGRDGGLLAHAVLLPLDDTRPAGDFGSALLAFLRGFGRPEVHHLDRLETYLESCRRRLQITVPPGDPAAALRLDAEIVLRLLHVSAATARADRIPWPAVDDLPGALIAAAALLPPRLRLGLVFTHGLDPLGGGCFAARGAPPSSLRNAPRGGAPWHYFHWLLDRHGAGDDDSIRSLTERWDLQTWGDLEQAIEGTTR
ncbi:MAG: hypothetical protein AAGN66_13955 [Acidobacteriota bacterium]